jgi:hypothetical protein
MVGLTKKNMNNAWTKSANNYSIKEISQQLPLLPVGIYKYQLDPYEQPYLTQITDKFTFPYKVYGVERAFIDRVKRSWSETTGNFGVLLNGVKGTGKTVTAEMICNEMNMPVIIIPFHHSSIVSFLNEIQQNVIVFIDEFEKIYDGYNNSLLPIMDGALKTKHRLMFLLTTNELRIERNLLQRPSRIRYVKTFEDMTLSVIMEVVDDTLLHPELRECTIKMISELPIITMDLVKSIVQEVNIHHEDPQMFKSIFNVHSDREDLYDIYMQKSDGNKVEVATFTTIEPRWINPNGSSGSDFYIGGSYRGTILSVISENQVIVSEYTNVTLEDGSKTEKKEDVIYFLEKATKTHKSFHSYVF